MAEIDEFSAAPVPAPAGGRRGGGQKAQPGGGPGGSGSTIAKTALKVCLVPGCECMCKSEKNDCGSHVGSWFGFMSQAEDQGPEAAKMAKALMAPGQEEERGQATLEHSLKNPPCEKYANKQ